MRYHANQSWIFQRLRFRQARNATSQMFGNTRTRLVSIVLVSLLVAAFVGVGSYIGFRELAAYRIPFSGLVVALLFDFLFLSLSVMLFFSTGIIIYSSLFHSAETGFLLSTPARADHVFAYKFQTAMAFSSWAFLLLGCPILVAYGVVYAVSPRFFALLPVFLIGFVILPGALGSLACFLIVNFLPQRRKQVLVLLGGLLLLAVGWWGFNVLHSSAGLLKDSGEDLRNDLTNLLGQFQFAHSPLVPSHWMTQGLLAAARGDEIEAARPLALIWSNGLFAYLLATVAARSLYRRGFNRIATGSSLRKRYGGGWLDNRLTRLVWFLDPQTRLLIVKDFRTFRRDPAQWAQILIFTMLGLVYIVNSRQFYLIDTGEGFSQGVSVMNLAATAMLMCAFMGRFIYPLMSLEGKKFWILGLLPMRRERLLWGKFYFAAAGSLLLAEALVMTGDLMLGVGTVAVLLHVLTVAVLALGLSGLSVGLGATMPNFRETDPSKIAVGFGGTLNLIAGLLFLILVIGTMAAPFHVLKILNGGGHLSAQQLAFVAVGVAVGIGVGVFAVVVPLRLGIRTLRNMEF
ncbi:MAG: putative ABC transporter permease subunit [Gemmataceae bacterium]